MTSTRRTGLALMTILAAAALAGPAAAKPATNLKCNGCVSPGDLAANAKPAGIGFASSGATTALVQDAAAKSILTLQMKTPGRGFLVYAVDFMVSNVGKNPVVECSLSKGSKTLGQPVSMVPVDEGNTVVSFRRVLKTNKKAKITVALKCAATLEPGQIIAPNLIGTFVPLKY